MTRLHAFLQAALSLACITAARCAPPVVQTVNGTYQGAHLPAWNQDVFLGMPYAQPPVGQLRYKWPQRINSSFEGVRNATSYGFSCRQYGYDFAPGLSEDCLTINVVRPSGKHTEPLPVLVWIYGGGLYWGSSADPQYNLSGIVQVSQEMNRPMIAVSFNYRLNMYGFLQNTALLSEGSSNAGLADQRLALHWIQENIGAFGGDPKRVTVWGESAGAQSIGYHLFAYDGRNDGLFQGAIMESGGPRGAQIETLSWYNRAFEEMLATVGCSTASNKIACLRALDEATLYKAQPAITWNPILDGDLIPAYPFSQLAPQGKFNADVALLVGTNTDEGFGIAGNPNTDDQLFKGAFAWRSYSLTPPTIRRLMELYPDNPCYAPPYHITDCSRQEGKAVQARRANALGNDLVMQSGRRQMAEIWSEAGKAGVYSYRFDQRVWNAPLWDGVAHFVNVAYSFQNVSGKIGPSPAADEHLVLARKIGRAYVNFVHDFDPNGKGGQGNATVPALPEWPAYSKANPTNMVLNVTKCEVEPDTYRKEGMAYMMEPEVAKEMLS